MTSAGSGGAERRRLAVRVTKDAERQIRSGHPWLFDRSITSITPDDGRPGDLAVVFDSKRRFLAIGLYDPASPMRVKILHAGNPTAIDSSFWEQRLDEADRLRRALADDPETTAFRMVHGENDRLPGLVLDRYADTLVLKLYSAAWLAHLDAMTELVTRRYAPDAVVLRLSRLVQRDPDRPAHLADGTALVGVLPSDPVEYLENGLRLEADVVHGQKTGTFLDQRDNRARVRQLAMGRRVLDVYCCTGGFSVHAADGGATAVHSVDISEGAIGATRRVMAGNPGSASTSHTTATADAMQEMERLVDAGRRFDLVIVDPPSFASRSDHRIAALRAYGRLAELAAELTEPGGKVMLASCSSRVDADEHLAAVSHGVERAGSVLVDVIRTAHAVDHPVGFPEGAYLKAVFATVRPRRSGL